MWHRFPLNLTSTSLQQARAASARGAGATRGTYAVPGMGGSGNSAGRILTGFDGTNPRSGLVPETTTSQMPLEVRLRSGPSGSLGRPKPFSGPGQVA